MKPLLIFICITVTCINSSPINSKTLTPVSKVTARDVNSLVVNSGDNNNLLFPEDVMNATILEVQKILDSDPSLPRLTRGEIIDLFENVTRNEEFQQQRALQQARQVQNRKHIDEDRNNRAIMLVLPFNTTNLTDINLQELYTRTPVTKIVAGDNTTSSGNTQHVTSQILNKTGVKNDENKRIQTNSQRYLNHKYSEKTNKSNIESSRTDQDVVQYPLIKNEIRNVTLDVINPPKRISGTKHNNEDKVVSTINVTSVNEAHKPIKYSSQYNAATTTFVKNNKPTVVPMRENVKTILASIGLYPVQPEPGMLTSTTPPSNNINLSHDMTEFLSTFGLVNNPPKAARLVEQNNYKSEYTRFKPLPEDSDKLSEDMGSFLSKFGLLPEPRQKKALKPTTELPTTSRIMKNMPDVSLDMFPDSMQQVLDNLGMSKGRRIKQAPQKSNVFNPDRLNNTNDDIEKLNAILETIRALEKLNTTISQEDLKQLGLNFTRNDILKDGPNPVFDKNVDDSRKNEVKRQQPSVTEETLKFDLLISNFSESVTERSAELSTTDTITTTSKTTTTTTESPNGNIKDLEDSFGSPVDPAVAASEEELPPPRKNGLYFLVDWNSFLEVGEEDENKVNIRFEPKIGDPSRFISVTVP